MILGHAPYGHPYNTRHDDGQDNAVERLVGCFYSATPDAKPGLRVQNWNMAVRGLTGCTGSPEAPISRVALVNVAIIGE